MRRLILFILLVLFCATTTTAQYVALKRETFTAVADGTVVRLIGSSASFHKVTWNKIGTVTVCSLKVEQSATGTGGWTDLIATQDCSASGTTVIVAATPNYVRAITHTTFTGTGSVVSVYTGYVNNPTGGVASVSGTAEEISSTGGATPVLSIPAVVNLSGKTLKGGSPLLFDGVTANANKTTLVVTDPTAARNFTLPNADSVAVQPDAGAANQFLTAISVLGVVSKAQPTLANIAGGVAPANSYDFEGATVTRPFRRLAFASFPGTCTANREFLERSDPATAGQVLYVCNAAGTGWDLVGDGPPAPAFDPNSTSTAYVRDEFQYGTTTSGSIGDLGWLLTTIGSTPIITAQGSTYPNLGVTRFLTAVAATAGQGGFLSSIVGVSGDLATNTNWQQNWIFRLVQTADTRFRAGFGSTSTLVLPTNGIYLRYDTTAGIADTTFWLCVSNAGAETCVNTTVSATTGWRGVKLYSTVAGTVRAQMYTAAGAATGTDVCLNSGGTGGCTAATIPTATMYAALILGTDATAQKAVEVDFYAAKWTGLSR